MTPAASTARPRLILYAARYQNPQKSAVASTLAWLAEANGYSFDLYYDAFRGGGHYGGGDPATLEPGTLTGGLVTGGRHLEVVATALQRFETTVVCAGPTAISNTVAALAEASGARVYDAEEYDLVDLYDRVFSLLETDWPSTAVMLNAAPYPGLDGIDAYCYPEIFYRRALGIEAALPADQLRALRLRGVEDMLTCGVGEEQRMALTGLGFRVRDLGVICEGDDYAAVTSRLAKRWEEKRSGWLIGDPTLVAFWLPIACRERRTPIYSVPQSRVIEMLAADIAGTNTPILGRQFADEDFFELSKLGQSFQLVDPARPVLPVLQTYPTLWASSLPDPRAADPTDADLRTWARQGRVLASLVFWTGMMRETENLYALMDVLALTGLRAGLALTSQSAFWRPSPLDLLTVPWEQGGVFPHVEILLASCGTGAAIESLLSPGRLKDHLRAATDELERAALPRVLWPEGWWATMDARMVPLDKGREPRPIRWRWTAPYFQLRFQPRNLDAANAGSGPEVGRRPGSPGGAARRIRAMVRDSRLSHVFEAYRPYERFEPGPVDPQLARTVQEAGFSYMLSKSGFGRPPHTVWSDGDFVAINYTAGQWDGWTPFETVNDVHDLRQAERKLLASGQPGWLLGSIDTCLWAFSGELWRRAPGLASIARHVAGGGVSGRLINVTPRVVARYARIIAELDRERTETS